MSSRRKIYWIYWEVLSVLPTPSATSIVRSSIISDRNHLKLYVRSKHYPDERFKIVSFMRQGLLPRFDSTSSPRIGPDIHPDGIVCSSFVVVDKLRSESTDGQRVNGTLTSFRSGWLWAFRSRARASRYKPPDYSRLLSLWGRVTRITDNHGHADNDNSKHGSKRTGNWRLLP